CHRDLALRVDITHGRLSYSHHAWCRINDGCRIKCASLKRRCGTKRLKCRSWLKQVDNCTVTGTTGQVDRIVRVVTWHIGHCQHFPAFRVQHNCSTCLRLVSLDCLGKFPISKVLDTPING